MNDMQICFTSKCILLSISNDSYCGGGYYFLYKHEGEYEITNKISLTLNSFQEHKENRLKTNGHISCKSPVFLLFIS